MQFSCSFWAWRLTVQLFEYYVFNLANKISSNIMIMHFKILLLCIFLITIIPQFSLLKKKKISKKLLRNQNILPKNYSEYWMKHMLKTLMGEVHPRKVVIWRFFDSNISTEWNNHLYSQFSPHFSTAMIDTNYRSQRQLQNVELSTNTKNLPGLPWTFFCSENRREVDSHAAL